MPLCYKACDARGGCGGIDLPYHTLPPPNTKPHQRASTRPVNREETEAERRADEIVPQRECRVIWCRTEDSNPAHPRYKGGALPDELVRHWRMDEESNPQPEGVITVFKTACRPRSETIQMQSARAGFLRRAQSFKRHYVKEARGFQELSTGSTAASHQ